MDRDPPSGVRLRDAAFVASLRASGPVTPSTPGPPGPLTPFDARAFHAFARHHYGRAADWARVLHVRQDIAEEALQLAMIALWEKRDSVDVTRWPGWLLVAAVLRKVTFLRKETRLRKREAIVTFAFFEDLFTPSPEIELLRLQCEREALWLVEQVKAGRRPVVKLHLLEDLPLSEVADALRIPLGTAKSRYQTGLEDMRKAYARKVNEGETLLTLAGLLGSLVAMLLALRVRIASLFRGARARLASLVGRRGSAMDARASLDTASSELHAATGRTARGLVLVALAGLLALVLGTRAHEPPRVLEVARLASVEGLAAASATIAGEDIAPSTKTILEPSPERAPVVDVAHAVDVAPVAPRAVKLASTPHDKAVASRVVPVATVASPDAAGSAQPSPQAPQADEVDPEEALPILYRAAEAMHDGRVDVARAALRLYEAYYPGEKPFPHKYAILKRQVSP